MGSGKSTPWRKKKKYVAFVYSCELTNYVARKHCVFLRLYIKSYLQYDQQQVDGAHAGVSSKEEDQIAGLGVHEARRQVRDLLGNCA